LLESPLGPQQTTAYTAIGAMLLIANMVIMDTSGGYFDAAATSNPLLHVWSLSVEEQFYLAFPALILAAWMIGRRRNVSVRAAAIAVTALTVVSFVCALFCTYVDSPVLFVTHLSNLAFYASPTRAWEFGGGALVALWAHRRGPSSRRAEQAASPAGWGGIVILAVTNLLVDDQTPWPGATAMLPVVGTVSLIVAGTLGMNPISRILSAQPAKWVGDRSYSLYLWHWPLILFASQQWPGTLAPRMAAFASVVPAWLSYRYVERPIRESPSSTVSVLRFGVGAAAATACTALALAIFGVTMIPSAATYRAERTTLTHGRATGCMLDAGRAYVRGDVSRCFTRVARPKGWVMLAGDSHADAISNSVVTAANRLGYDALALTGAGCTFARDAAPSNLVPNCSVMNNDLLDLATGAEPPALVVMSHWGAAQMDTGKRWPGSLDPTIVELRRARIPVLFVLDVPNFAAWDAGQAVSCRGGLLNFTCALPRKRVESIQGRARAAELDLTRRHSNVIPYDPWVHFCDQKACSSVVNGRLAYWDFDHLNGIGGSLLTDNMQRAMRTVMQATRRPPALSGDPARFGRDRDRYTRSGQPGG
jgi:peptidoglycan/LPS O-acetylase OafA/YrhL